MSIVEQSTPPLIAGDKLTRDEFLRRWHGHPEIKRSELIGGIVYMPSPVGFEHGGTEFNMASWSSVYVAATAGIKGCNNATTFLKNDAPQPDILLFLLPEYGGTCRIKGDYLYGPPELVIEICRSSSAYDLHQKLELYQRAGVAEYLAVLMYEQEIRWHRLGAEGYQLLDPTADGVWRSQVFPGLWLAGKALLEDNMSHVLATLNQGLQSAEHAAFVASLAVKKSS